MALISPGRPRPVIGSRPTSSRATRARESGLAKVPRIIRSAGMGEGNVIVSNQNGVDLDGSGTSFNVLQGNRIGVDAAGNAAGNQVDGVDIGDGASYNQIGIVCLRRAARSRQSDLGQREQRRSHRESVKQQHGGRQRHRHECRGIVSGRFRERVHRRAHHRLSAEPDSGGPGDEPGVARGTPSSAMA